VLYDEGAYSEQAQAQSGSLSNTYDTSVHMIPIATESEFAEAWNNMGSDGTAIDGVSLLFHGTSDAITIDHENSQYMTIYSDGKNPQGK